MAPTLFPYPSTYAELLENSVKRKFDFLEFPFHVVRE
jgi:hypothetical protein